VEHIEKEEQTLTRCAESQQEVPSKTGGSSSEAGKVIEGTQARLERHYEEEVDRGWEEHEGLRRNVDEPIRHTRFGKNDEAKRLKVEDTRRATEQHRKPAAAGSSTDDSTVRKRGREGKSEKGASSGDDSGEEHHDDIMLGAPLSRSREKRIVKPIIRLGVVSGETPAKARKQRRTKSEIIYMEHAGASSGELKYLIRAGRELIRRVEKRSREEEEEQEESDSADNGDENST
jgi:hypothetical protein